MIGFRFNNTHSSDHGVGAKSIDRSLLPSKRRSQFVIPGRDGTVDFEANKYNNRQIAIELGFVNNINHNELRNSAREVAKWLSGQGMLIFDDEPEKAYQAKTYDYIGIEQIQGLPAGRSTIVFECQPFAESLEYNQVNQDVNAIPTELELEVKGTAETPCIITIKNIGTTTIQNISITRKAAI